MDLLTTIQKLVDLLYREQCICVCMCAPSIQSLHDCSGSRAADFHARAHGCDEACARS